MVLPVVQWLLALGLSFHPFYVSLTQFSHNSKEKSIEISVRIFTDDLENTLSTFSGKRLDMARPASPQQADAILHAYLKKHLAVKVNGTYRAYNYVGFEINEESVWTYLEITGVAALKELQVENSLLHDYKKEQVNIVNVKANGEDQSRKLDYPDRTLIFKW